MPFARETLSMPLELSLLWPEGYGDRRAVYGRLPEHVMEDLGIPLLGATLLPDEQERIYFMEVLQQLCIDAEVIAFRQDILEDFLDHPALAERFEDLRRVLEELTIYHRRTRVLESSPLYDVAWRLGELESIVQFIEGLGGAFVEAGGSLRSTGLKALADSVQRIQEDTSFRSLVNELPAMLSAIRAARSLTLGVNLDDKLRPVAATLLSINDQVFTASTFLDRLLGRSDAQWSGIAPLHTVPDVESPSSGMIGVQMTAVQPARKMNPLMVPLFKDLANIMDKTAQPIAHSLRAYVQFSARFFAGLRRDFGFYLAALKLIRRLREWGMPTTRPVIVPQDQRIFELKDSYNVNLVLKVGTEQNQPGVAETVVTNDVTMGPTGGRIFILTGPNQGGKTTYTQALGLAQVLAQAGLHVPASRAHISPVDGVFSHFPTEEDLEMGTGRFGDEARRLSAIFAEATANSFLLLNESLASTGSGESLYLAQDLVKIMRRMGLRAVFTTHLHELALSVDELNATSEGDSKIVSMVASRVDEEGGSGDQDRVQRSYKIAPGPAMGRSYATQLARRYGISYDQLLAELEARGVLG